MLEAFREALTFALEERQANIVCVSELGLPSRNAMPLADAQRIAFKLSCKYNALIVAGTAHDYRTNFNTGYLFHPAKRPGTWAFHKSASALSMGERIMTPARRRVVIIDAFGLRIATMICLDIVDYTMLAAIMAAGDQVDVVLVPSYTLRSEKMRDVAKVASQALPGVVALVNARLPDAGSCFISQCGLPVTVAEQTTLAGGAEVAILPLKVDDLKEKRTQAKNELPVCLDWMFGNRYIPQKLQAPLPLERRQRP
jgi:predicted amidohydrolase